MIQTRMLKKVDLPPGFALEVGMFEGRRVYIPVTDQTNGDGSHYWSHIYWNRADYIYLPQAFKVDGCIAFSTKALAITFIIGWHWHMPFNESYGYGL